MSEQKFDPVKEFVALRDNLTKTVGDGIKSVAGIKALFPLVDIYETSEAIMLYTEPLLGADPSSIEVSVENNVLIIKGATQTPFDIPISTYLHRELRFGQFYREVQLPHAVVADEARAAFRNGVLHLTLPKQKKKPSQIVDITPVE